MAQTSGKAEPHSGKAVGEEAGSIRRVAANGLRFQLVNNAVSPAYQIKVF